VELFACSFAYTCIIGTGDVSLMPDVSVELVSNMMEGTFLLRHLHVTISFYICFLFLSISQFLDLFLQREKNLLLQPFKVLHWVVA
jgi:hypothetical protein